MKEVDIDISTHHSEEIKEDILKKANFVITLCGDADEKCPSLPSTLKKIHWDLSDPVKAKGSEQEILEQFRNIRDEIKERILQFIEKYS